MKLIIESVKKIGKVLGIVILCLSTMKAGDGDTGNLRTGEDIEVSDSVSNSVAYAGDHAGQTQETINITIVDEFPAESEIQLHILGEDRQAGEDKEDSIFVQMTNLMDTGPAEVYLVQENGCVEKDEGISIEINTAKFFVPDGGSRCFGVPNFFTEIFGEGEWERRQELEEIDLIGNDCEDFNPGIDVTRQLVNDGYLNEEITNLLSRFPEINPYERNYTLRLVNAGSTLREKDQTGWWDVDYALYTEADNGEELMLVYIDITRVTLVQGEVWGWDDAHYRIDAVVENLWQLMEDPVMDQGEVWLQQVKGNVLSDEEAVRRFVEEQGASIVVPKGADMQVEWECRRQEEFYYDYLIWQGETADYEVTLAIPLMEKQEEGYYLAFRIRKEAADKSACNHILSGMMQTFQGVPYLHVVKEGESLARIAEKYQGTQEGYPGLKRYDDDTGEVVPFANQNLIYPGQKVWMPFCREYDGRWEVLISLEDDFLQ